MIRIIYLIILGLIITNCASVETICDREYKRRSGLFSSKEECLSFNYEKSQRAMMAGAIIGNGMGSAISNYPQPSFNERSTCKNPSYKDFTGCCSHHGGIMCSGGNYLFDYDGQVVCKDGISSKSDACNRYKF